jgi:hypothetical protein
MVVILMVKFHQDRAELNGPERIPLRMIGVGVCTRMPHFAPPSLEFLAVHQFENFAWRMLRQKHCPACPECELDDLGFCPCCEGEWLIQGTIHPDVRSGEHWWKTTPGRYLKDVHRNF